MSSSRKPMASGASPVGLHRVVAPEGVLPQAAERLDTRRDLWPDEVRVRAERLNLDAASFRQLERKHEGDGAAVRDTTPLAARRCRRNCRSDSVHAGGRGAA